MENNGNPNLTFTWSCKNITGNSSCFNKAGVPLELLPITNISIPGYVIPKGSQLLFGLQVCTTLTNSQVCSDTTYQNVNISQEDIIETLEIDCTGKKGMIVNLQDPVLVGADIRTLNSSQYKFIWDCGNLQTKNLEQIYENNKLNVPFIKIKPYSLSLGVNYLFKLTRMNIATQKSISSQISVTINNPPIPGNLIVTPFTGIEHTTVFTLQVSSWTDIDYNYPLTYRYGYRTQRNSSIVYITTKITTDLIQCYLPLSLESSNLVEIWVEVYDSLGGMQNASVNVTVFPSQSDISNSILERMQNASATSVTNYCEVLSEFMGALDSHKNDEFQTRGNSLALIKNLNTSLTQINSMTSEAREVIVSSLIKISRVNSNITSDIDEKTISFLNGFLKEEITRLSNIDGGTIQRWKSRRGLSDQGWISVASLIDLTVKKQISSVSISAKTMSDNIKMIGRGYLDSLIPSSNATLQTDSFSVSALAFTSDKNMQNLKISSMKGSIQLPSQGIFGNVSQQSPITLIYSESPNYVHQSVPVSSKLRSNATLSLSAYNTNNTDISLNGLSSPINLTFLQVTPAITKSQIACYFYNSSINMFSNRGVILAQQSLSTNSVICSASHLTDFMLLEVPSNSGIINSFYRKTGNITFKNNFRFASFCWNYIPFFRFNWSYHYFKELQKFANS